MVLFRHRSTSVPSPPKSPVSNIEWQCDPDEQEFCKPWWGQILSNNQFQWEPESPSSETLPEYDQYFQRPSTPPLVERDERSEEERFTETHHDVLLLHGIKQPYELVKEQRIPALTHESEMLVKVEAIGLNPIDWKAPAFGFGLPALPCISGRDIAGTVVLEGRPNSRFKRGDRILGISTDYRDSRKSAFQQYAVVPDFNACRLPDHLQAMDAAPLGVAYVAAALALGICMGVRFPGTVIGCRSGPDLLEIIRNRVESTLPIDIQAECFHGIRIDERAQPGDWIAIWGGSSTSGCCAIQLAKRAGLKVICVMDVAKNGGRMLKYGADLLVDRHDPDRAISIIHQVTQGNLRFALDTVGKDTARLLASALRMPAEGETSRSHLVGLTGLPKETIPGIAYHSVPIKAFHEVSDVGEGLMIWLEDMLAVNHFLTPDIKIASGGLGGINGALDRLRTGEVSGFRLVVPL